MEYQHLYLQFHNTTIYTIILYLLTFLVATSYFLLARKCNLISKRIKNNKHPSRTLTVLGSGGHTTEMIRLLSSLNKENFVPIYYVVASTDTTSINRLNNKISQNIADSHCNDEDNSSSNLLMKPKTNEIFIIPRSREVGQSYITSIFSTLFSILSSAHIILKTKPDVLIVNGPGTCLPIVFWTYIGRLIGFCQGKIIFCESFCRVNSLSLTGKILLQLGMVDLFLVHWQELMDVIHKQYDIDGQKRYIQFALIDSFITNNDSK